MNLQDRFQFDLPPKDSFQCALPPGAIPLGAMPAKDCPRRHGALGFSALWRLQCQAIEVIPAGIAHWPKRARFMILALFAGFMAPIAARAAAPVVDSVSAAARGNEHLTLLDVTFTFHDAENDPCYLAIWGFDAATLEYIPMQRWVEGGIFDRVYPPGTYTFSWIASADFGGRSASNFKVYVRASDAGRIAPGRFMVMDVSGGPSAASYPVSIVDYVDVRLDANKTDKIVFRELPDGSWAGVYEVTQRQYERVTGLNPSNFANNPKRPVRKRHGMTLLEAAIIAAALSKSCATRQVCLDLICPSKRNGNTPAAPERLMTSMISPKTGARARATRRRLGDWRGMATGQPTAPPTM